MGFKVIKLSFVGIVFYASIIGYWLLCACYAGFMPLFKPVVPTILGRWSKLKPLILFVIFWFYVPQCQYLLGFEAD